MHSKKVMHRDLKTENILLAFVIIILSDLFCKNQIKLCDLGCVAEVDERRNTFCGTIDYIAPEVITRGENAHSKGYD
jgi:aurora kinase